MTRFLRGNTLLLYGRMKEEPQKEEMRRRPRKRALYVVILEMAFIFAIPAFLVLGIGVYTDVSRLVFFTLLGLAFIISWIAVAYRIRTFSRNNEIVE